MEGSNLFGIQSTSSIDDTTSNFLLGEEAATVTSLPSDVSKLEIEDEEEKKKNKAKETVNLSEDDILGKPDSEEIEKGKAPVSKPVETNEEVTDSIDYNALSQSLIQLGVFSELEDGEEIKTDQDFAEKFQNEAIKKANQEIYNILTERHGEEALKAFQAIYINGISPAEYFEKNTDIQNLKDIDLSIESNQEKVLREYYKRNGWDQEKIDKKIQKAIDFGIIDEEASDAHEFLVKNMEEELNKQIEQKENEAKVAAMQRAQYHSNLQQILSEKLKTREFDGIPVTEKIANETIDYLFTEKWKLPNGEKLTDFDKALLELKRPENHEKKIKLALLLRSNLDLSKLKTANQINKKTEQIFKDIARKDTHIKRSPSHSSSSFFDNIH